MNIHELNPKKSLIIIRNTHKFIVNWWDFWYYFICGGYVMGIFINCLAVVFSTIIAICGISYFAREKNAGKLRYYMLVMGFFGALWSGGVRRERQVP